MKFLGHCLAVLPAMAFTAAAVAQQPLPQTIRIGASLALTGSTSASGALGRAAIDMAVNDINAAGGAAGRRVEVVYADDQQDPTRAVTEMKRLLDQEKVHVISGPGASALAMAVAPDLKREKIFSLPFTGASSVNPQTYPYGFATFYPADAFAKVMADYAVDVLKAKSLGVVTDNGPGGHAAADVISAYLPSKGMKPPVIEFVEFVPTDLIAQALRLKRAGVDAIIQYSSNEHAAARIFQATEQMGWDVPIVSQVSSVFPKQIQALVGSNPYASGRLIGLTAKATTYCTGENASQAPYAKFVTRVKATLPDWQKFPMSLAGYYYDSIQLVKAAIDGTKSVDGPTMAAWVEENSAKVPSLMGRFSASKTSHILYGADSFAFTKHPDQSTSDGLSVREGCG